MVVLGRRPLFALLVTLGACGAPAPPVAGSPCPTAPQASVGPPTAPSLPPGARHLDVTLSHEKGRLAVEVLARAPRGELAELTELPAAAREVTRAVDGGRPARVSTLTGAADASAVAVRYVLDLPQESDGRLDAPQVDARGFHVTGASALVFPRAFEAATVDVDITIRTDVGDEAVRGSSYGVGEHREAHTTGLALLRAIYLAGPGGRAELHAPEGHDDALWLGYPAFDPRAVAAEVAGFRTALHEVFLGHEPLPSTLILLTDARPRGRFAVARTTRGVTAALSGHDAWDAPLRLAVATELVHAWIGDLVWLGPADAGADRVWFHDGIARALAREELFRVGLLTPEEYLGEISGAISEVLLSPHRAGSNAALAARVGERGVKNLLLARGALYGATVGARVRRATKGQASLSRVARVLYAAASERRGPLETSRWLEAVSALTDRSEATRDFDLAITRGEAERIPVDALGPCFAPARVRYERVDLGFDEALSRSRGRVEGLEPDGPAAKAGLAGGERLVDVTRDAKGRVTLAIVRAAERAPEHVALEPRVTRKEGPGFRRRPEVKADACR